MKEVNMSLEEMCGEKIREIRERDKEFLPDVNWFSRMDTEKMHTYMAKYQFSAFEDIPSDNSGLCFPAFGELQFELPPVFQPELNARLPVSRQRKPVIVQVDGLLFLKHLGAGAFCIDPRRWHTIKTYISKGTVIYPKGLTREFGVSDGRHRTLLLMQLYKIRYVPVVLDEKCAEKFLGGAKKLNALKM
ncbi:hypothetical protein [Pantoea sp. AG702]|uniref:hypothetical protein n=1 Tax=Pantoea sp. AG702 TaxID=2183907 RepID=UPI000D911A69|nr:hypothetical protein [Pantoea sp. AG702]PWW11066.1 hypothetical protein DFO57_11148 [Pantoea sp. AG702]